MRERIRNFEERVENPTKISPDDRIVQIFMNENYDLHLLMRSGRLFKARARGRSGSYDRWHEIDVLAEVRQDLSINDDENANS